MTGLSHSPNTEALVESYPQKYLKEYWPELPHTPVGWADNAILMIAYQEAALAAKKFLGHDATALDISTGPALAPILAMVNCIRDVQLSDFDADNRKALKEMPIEYWRNYVPMLVRLYAHPEQQSSEILAKLDNLRRSHEPLSVDLFVDYPFGKSFDYGQYDLITMQFVADSITENQENYLRCLEKVTDMVKPGAAFIMSAIVDSQGWQMGDSNKPSPNVSEETVLEFIQNQGMKELYLSRSIRHVGQTYSGGWIVLSAARPK